MNQALSSLYENRHILPLIRGFSNYWYQEHQIAQDFWNIVFLFHSFIIPTVFTVRIQLIVTLKNVLKKYKIMIFVIFPWLYFVVNLRGTKHTVHTVPGSSVILYHLCSKHSTHSKHWIIFLHGGWGGWGG